MSCSCLSSITIRLVVVSFCWCSLLLGAYAQDDAQGLPFITISLQDLGAFQPVAENWHVVGDISASLTQGRTLATVAGTGVLVNLPSDGARDNLFTAWEHGDIELKLRFMMPSGSNSGIYFQGRYEIQLFDSWGIEVPQHSDAGGIYQRWDEDRDEGNEGYEGHAPRMNVSRAPGLWQELHIWFRAPRFDASGQKVANARFERVVFNGVVIHEDVELFGPTRAAAFDDEQSTGPLMLQGDHGPVAFKDLFYKTYSESTVTLTDVSYQYAEGEFVTLDHMTGVAPLRQGDLSALTSSVAEAKNNFGLTYQGTITLPVAGDYFFEMISRGPALLTVDGRPLVENDGSQPANQRGARMQAMEAGSYPFALQYAKTQFGWRGPSLRLTVEGPQIRRTALTSDDSYESLEPSQPIYEHVEAEPLVHRAFLVHQGIKYTHAAAVGFPQNLHFMVDFQQGAVLNIWKGEFLDVTDMWHGRGEPQTAEPLGSVIEFEAVPLVRALAGPAAAWQEIGAFQFNGYRFSEARYPIFQYEVAGLAVEDQMVPAGDGPYFQRIIRVEGATDVPLAIRLAAADRMEHQGNNRYVVGDHAYYVAVETGEAHVRTHQGQQELIVPLRFEGSRAEVVYSIIW